MAVYGDKKNIQIDGADVDVQSVGVIDYNSLQVIVGTNYGDCKPGQVETTMIAFQDVAATKSSLEVLAPEGYFSIQMPFYHAWVLYGKPEARTSVELLRLAADLLEQQMIDNRQLGTKRTAAVT